MSGISFRKQRSWRKCFATQRGPPKAPPIQVDRSTLGCKQPPLTKPLPELPETKYATVKDEDRASEITVLPNGLRVASETRFGQFCTVGGLFSTFLFLHKPILLIICTCSSFWVRALYCATKVFA